MLAVLVLVAFGDRYRLWTDAFLVWLVITGYEAITTATMGATPGKALLGVRIVELDRRGKPSPRAAWRRSAMSAVLVLIGPVGGVVSLALLGTDQPAGAILVGLATLALWGMWLLSVLGDPLGRGFADRAGTTMVVGERYDGIIAVRDLPGFADAVRPPRMTPLGRLADADVRVRARLRRLDDAPVLAGAIGLLALGASVPLAGDDPGTARLVVLASSAAWIALFVGHETRRVHRTGATPGHELAGLRIVRRDRFEPPSAGRSFARALVLGLTLYVPLLWPALGASLLMMRYGGLGRGLHDLAGGTIVVSDPSLSPETQRQRAMRMRMGRAG